MKVCALSLSALASLGSCASRDPGIRPGAENHPVEPAPLVTETVASPVAPRAEVEISASGLPADVTAAHPDSPADAATESDEDPARATAPPASSWAFFHERYDTDGDGRITRPEYTRSDLGFTRLDANADGALSAEDFARRWDSKARVPEKKYVWGVGGPEFGEPAPEFRLRSTTGAEIELSRFRGKKPVVLVFGSFT